MKKKDIGLIVVMGIISGTLSVLLSGKLFVTPDDRKQAVEVAPAIVGELPRPENAYFNDVSVNPAQNITIGRDPNSNPFNGGQ